MLTEPSAEKLALFTTWVAVQVGDWVTTFGATASDPTLKEQNPLMADVAGSPVAWKILLGKVIVVWLFWKLLGRPRTKKLWLYWTMTAVFALVVVGNALTWWLT
jgi:hypothetical protein